MHCAFLAAWIGVVACAAPRPAGESHESSGDALVIEGTATVNGTASRFRLIATRDGRFARRVTGPLPDAAGFDGTNGWRVDWTGMPRPIALWELDYERLLVAAFAGTWADRNSGVVVAPSSNTDGDNAGFAGRPRLANLAADGRTARSLRFVANIGTEEIRFSDHRPIGDLVVAFAVEQQNDGRTKARYRVERVRWQPVAAHELAAPAEPDDAAFDAAHTVVPLRRASGGELLVAARIDGADAGWFMFDSGASQNIISATLARRLGLARVGSTLAHSGFGSSEAAVSRARTLSVGAVTLRAPLLTEVDLTPLDALLGEPLAGFIGYDLLRRAVVELDFARGRLVLHPRGFAAAGIAWNPLNLDQGLPNVRASLPGGTEHWFRLVFNTGRGAFGNAAIARHTAEALGLMRGIPLKPIELGRGSIFDVGTLASLELAGRRFEQVPVAFARGRDVFVGDPFTAGHLGRNLLGDQRILLDYGGARWALLPASTK